MTTKSTVIAPKDADRQRPQYIIVFRSPSEHNTSQLSSILHAGGAAKTRRTREGRIQLRSKQEGRATTLVYERLGVAVADLNPDERDKLLASDTVEAIEPNQLRRIPPLPEPRPLPTLEGFAGGSAIPRNPAIAYLKGLRDAADLALAAMGAGGPGSSSLQTPQSGPISWCLEMIGLSLNYSKATGKGVKVAVLDTGIDLTHPDFQGRFTEGVDAFSFIKDETVQDVCGHGTHCAGVIAGPVSSACRTRYGVAPDVTLLVGKVLGGPEGEGYDDGIFNAIDWAADQGARVISMSIGDVPSRKAGASYNRAYERVASNFLGQKDGPLLVAAAGNASNRPNAIMPVNNPAACPSIMAVAAVDSGRGVAYFSCGETDLVGQLDVSAPGVSVQSAWMGGGYISISGTSMATPHVAGAAALHLEVNPSLSPRDLWSRLTSTAAPIDPKRDFGHGIVRVP